MTFNCPIPRSGLPVQNESSGLRSARDGDSLGGQWKKNKPVTGQTNANTRAISNLQTQVNKLRRRIVGGGATPSSGMNFRGEFDPTASYVVQDVAIVSSGSNSGTYICILASTGNNPWAGGGYWVQLPQGQLGLWM